MRWWGISCLGCLIRVVELFIWLVRTIVSIKLDKVDTHPNLVVRQFSSEISALLRNADLAISRAGSGQFVN